MANTIGKGALYVSVNADQLTAGLTKARKDIKGFSTDLGGISFFGTGGVGAAVAGFKMLTGYANDFISKIQEAGDRAEQIMNSAQAFGVSAESFQTLSNAAKLAGVDMDSIQKAMRAMSEVIVSGAQNEETALKKLASVGLTPDDLIGKGTDKAFLTILDAASKLQNPMQRLKALGDIFGDRQALRLSPLASGEFLSSVNQIGQFSLTESHLKKMDEMADKWTTAGIAWQSVFDKMKLAGGGGELADKSLGLASDFDNIWTVAEDRAKKNGGNAFVEIAKDLNKSLNPVAILVSRIKGEKLSDNLITGKSWDVAAQAQKIRDNVTRGPNVNAPMTVATKDNKKAQEEAKKAAEAADKAFANFVRDQNQLLSPLMRVMPQKAMMDQFQAMQNLMSVGQLSPEDRQMFTFNALSDFVKNALPQMQAPKLADALIVGTNEELRSRLESQLQGATPNFGDLLLKATDASLKAEQDQAKKMAEIVAVLDKLPPKLAESIKGAFSVR